MWRTTRRISFLKYAAQVNTGAFRPSLVQGQNLSAEQRLDPVLATIGDAGQAAMKVALTGVLLTSRVGDKKASESRPPMSSAFDISIELHVSEFKETSDQDPFGASNSTGAAARPAFRRRPSLDNTLRAARMTV